MLLVALSCFETFCIQMVPKWSQVTLAATHDYIDRHKGHSLKCNLEELYSEELLQFSLTQNLPCVIITSVKIITDRYTGDSRGFGFVEMPNHQEAKSAISELDGKDLKGRTLKVNEARPREDRGGGFGGKRRF